MLPASCFHPVICAKREVIFCQTISLGPRGLKAEENAASTWWLTEIGTGEVKLLKDFVYVNCLIYKLFFIKFPKGAQEQEVKQEALRNASPTAFAFTRRAHWQTLCPM